MKKRLALMALCGLLTYGFQNVATAQSEGTDTTSSDAAMTQDQPADTAAGDSAATMNESGGAMNESGNAMQDGEGGADASDEAEKEKSFHQSIKKTFIDGGPFFMSFVLIAFILGLALCIERIIYLNMASINKNKFLRKIEDALQSGGVPAAKDVCRDTRGPIASICYQGLDRYDEGIDVVEKSVESYGGVQMSLLEKGLSWISLFIAIAPMLGFMGTVIGMIGAFDAIEASNNISPGIVAGGIKVALITTVSGLIVAIILQIFYNYIISKVDSLVHDMEDSSISLIDMLLRHKETHKGGNPKTSNS